MARADHRILNHLITAICIVDLARGSILDHHLWSKIANNLRWYHLLHKLLALIRAVIRQELLVQLLHLAGDVDLSIL